MHLKRRKRWRTRSLRDEGRGWRFGEEKMEKSGDSSGWTRRPVNARPACLYARLPQRFALHRCAVFLFIYLFFDFPATVLIRSVLNVYDILFVCPLMSG